jgi:hypothetical protein
LHPNPRYASQPASQPASHWHTRASPQQQQRQHGERAAPERVALSAAAAMDDGDTARQLASALESMAVLERQLDALEAENDASKAAIAKIEARDALVESKRERKRLKRLAEGKQRDAAKYTLTSLAGGVRDLIRGGDRSKHWRRIVGDLYTLVVFGAWDTLVLAWRLVHWLVVLVFVWGVAFLMSVLRDVLDALFAFIVDDVIEQMLAPINLVIRTLNNPVIRVIDNILDEIFVVVYSLIGDDPPSNVIPEIGELDTSQGWFAVLEGLSCDDFDSGWKELVYAVRYLFSDHVCATLDASEDWSYFGDVYRWLVSPLTFDACTHPEDEAYCFWISIGGLIYLLLYALLATLGLGAFWNNFLRYALDLVLQLAELAVVLGWRLVYWLAKHTFGHKRKHAADDTAAARDKLAREQDGGKRARAARPAGPAGPAPADGTAADMAAATTGLRRRRRQQRRRRG